MADADTAVRWLGFVAACLVVLLLGRALRALYRHFARWAHPGDWRHPAGRITRKEWGR